MAEVNWISAFTVTFFKIFYVGLIIKKKEEKSCSYSIEQDFLLVCTDLKSLVQLRLFCDDLHQLLSPLYCAH